MLSKVLEAYEILRGAACEWSLPVIIALRDPAKFRLRADDAKCSLRAPILTLVV